LNGEGGTLDLPWGDNAAGRFAVLEFCDEVVALRGREC
jgi:hypothetical protein